MGDKPNFQDFCVLMKESSTRNIRQGDFFCLEGYTRVEDKLHILMSGRMSVKCDGVFLHNINPNEFVDSIEWNAKDYDHKNLIPVPTFKAIGGLFRKNTFTGRPFQVRIE